MSELTLELDDFNDRLLAGHSKLAVAGARLGRWAVYGLLAASVAAGAYFAVQQGWHERAMTYTQSVLQESPKQGGVVVGAPPAQKVVVGRISLPPPPTAAKEEPVQPVSPAQGQSELERILSKLERAEKAAAAVEGESTPAPVAKPEPPMVVAKPRQPVARGSEGKAELKAKAQVKPVESGIVARSMRQPQEMPAQKEESILLFRKPAAPPVAARVPAPVVVGQGQPAVVQQEPVPSPVQPVGRQHLAPILVVEETGVRIVGPEGERFIPIGGLLNGQRVLATSPKIGLIVTEGSAIRVPPTTKEQK